MHGAEELTGVALIAVTAALIGLVLVRMRQPAIVGYILTGILLGPSVFGLVTDRDAIAFLAELGVILLLYFIGMELSLRSFRLIWKGAVLVAMAQITLALLAMVPPTMLFDWPISWLILGGFCLALSSTAVAFNILDDVGAKKSRAGRMAIGILIAQDLAVAPMLLIIDGLKNFTPVNIDGAMMVEVDLKVGLASIGLQLLLTIGLLILLIIYLSRKQRIHFAWLLHAENRPDLLPLVALASCFGAAFLAGSMGLSPAFGAFMAGLVVGNSTHRESMRHSAEPIQVVLLMVFFLSVGLLLDLGFVWDNILLILLLWILVTVFKTFCNMLLGRLIGLSWSDGLTVALVIAQMGEFSFVLAATALGAGVIDTDIHRMVVALTVLSLMVSPFYVQLVRRNRHRALRHIGGLKDVIKLVFFREYRISRKVTKTAVIGSKMAIDSSVRVAQAGGKKATQWAHAHSPKISEEIEDEAEIVEEINDDRVSSDAVPLDEDSPLSEDTTIMDVKMIEETNGHSEEKDE